MGKRMVPLHPNPPMRRISTFAALLIGMVYVASAQTPALPESSLPSDSGLPASSNYYEARITSDGYALYIPFYISAPGAPRTETLKRPQEAPSESEGGKKDAQPSNQGGLALRTREEIVPGEFIQVYRPAVYMMDEEGQIRLVEPEGTITLPKVRIVMEHVWLSGISVDQVDAMPNSGWPEWLPGISPADSQDSPSTDSIEPYP